MDSDVKSPKPLLQRTPPQKANIEIICVDDREATDFPCEPAGHGAPSRLLHVEPIDEADAAPIVCYVPHSPGGDWLREWSADVRYVSALTRTWRMSEASRPAPF